MKPYYQDESITIYHGDCREVLPTLGKVDLVLTDPPYGFHKAGWDDAFPMWIFDAVANVAPRVGIMPGVWNIPAMPHRIGHAEYKWMLIAYLVNGFARSLIGYGNYIPCMVYADEGIKVYQQDGDIAEIIVGGDKKPEHPSPKPFRAMRWFVSRIGGETILDPFMGSGTTLRAAKDLGRKAIGIEIEERYCEIAAKRMAQLAMAL